jgi:hypothetical protein
MRLHHDFFLRLKSNDKNENCLEIMSCNISEIATYALRDTPQAVTLSANPKAAPMTATATS